MLFFIFQLGNHRYGIPLTSIQRVVHSAEVTPLPGVAGPILGLLNIEGRIHPVLDLRTLFLSLQSPIGLYDPFLIVESEGRGIVLVVDSVLGLLECRPEDRVDGGGIIEGVHYLDGVLRTPDGLILMPSLAKLFSIAPQENRLIERKEAA